MGWLGPLCGHLLFRYVAQQSHYFANICLQFLFSRQIGTANLGPIVSAATNKFGCRVVLITGAFVASLGFGLSYFVKTFPLLILTYGFIGGELFAKYLHKLAKKLQINLAGVGFGMIFLPSIVCVGYYFERRRSIATGIAVCGSGK